MLIGESTRSAPRGAAAATAVVALLGAVLAMGPPPPPQEPPKDQQPPDTSRNYFFVINEVQIEQWEEMFTDTRVVVEKQSETFSFVDGDVTIIQDMPTECTIQINCEKLMGNSWHVLAPTGPMPFCQYMEEQQDKMEMLWRASNFPHECPIQKQAVEVRNFTVMESVFPPQLDGDKWRVVIAFVCDKQQAMTLRVDVDLREKEDDE